LFIKNWLHLGCILIPLNKSNLWNTFVNKVILFKFCIIAYLRENTPKKSLTEVFFVLKSIIFHAYCHKNKTAMFLLLDTKEYNKLLWKYLLYMCSDLYCIERKNEKMIILMCNYLLLFDFILQCWDLNLGSWTC
jgi:hypothetical protein